MPLELRKNRDGSIRPIWYGRYKVRNKRYCSSLGIPIAGKLPVSPSLRDTGDPAFERSRAKAQAKLDELVTEATSARDASRIAEKIYELKTGEALKRIPLDSFPDEWARIPRRRPLVKQNLDQSQSKLRSFVDYVQEHFPRVDGVSQITRTIVCEFLAAEAERGVAGRTYNESLKLIRSTLRHVLPQGVINPCLGIPRREERSVHRKPFSPEELKAIIEAAADDDFIRPIIITGMCTAMRRGDCCLLKWQDVDLANRFVNIKTSKTGQSITIPIFPMLYDELARREADGEYVFPEQAAVYQHNGHGITRRVRKVLKQAGFVDEKVDQQAPDLPDSARGPMHAERPTGLYRPSIRDFHSFRVTWVTLALTAGVPSCSRTHRKRRSKPAVGRE